MSGARSEDGRPAHARPDRDRDIATGGDNAAGALESHCEREWERDWVLAGSREAFDVVQTDGLDPNEHFVGLKRSEILRFNLNDIWTACPHCAGHAALTGNRHESYNVSNHLLCQLAFP
jgi:hypothetical protein